MRETITTKFEELQQIYPLSNKWGKIELFSETVIIEKHALDLIGLSVTNSEQMEVTASAGDWQQKIDNDETLISRAYYELLERTSICEAMNDNILSQYFPQRQQPTDWQYAKSNGVAAGANFEFAKNAAYAELFERDAILRSWYGATVIQSVSIDKLSDSPLCFIPKTQVKFYQFFSEPNLHVIAAFLFSENVEIPTTFGFAAHTSFTKAIDKAAQECSQRLGFLYGEPPVEDYPEFSATPSYHQDYFLRFKSHALLKEWLNNEHYKQCHSEQQLPTLSTKTTYIDITPRHLKNQLHIIKAVNDTCLPLIFGLTHQFAPPNFSKEWLIHPIA